MTLVGLAACTAQPSPRSLATEADATAASTSAGTDSTSEAPLGSEGDEASSPAGPLGNAQSCTNDDIGFGIDYPEEWWANERVEPSFEGGTPIPACTYFAPEAIELQPNAGLPPGIAVWFDRETQFEITGEELSREEVDVDGRRALAVETEATDQSGFDPQGTMTYRYVIDMGDGSEVLVATSTLYVPESEYEESKRILDAMIETLDFAEWAPRDP